MSGKENEPQPKRLSKEEFEDLLNDLNSLAAMPTNIPHATIKKREDSERWIDDMMDAEDIHEIQEKLSALSTMPTLDPTTPPTKVKKEEENKVIKKEIVEEEEKVKERWIDDESSDELLPILSLTPTLKSTTEPTPKQKSFHYNQSSPNKAIKPVAKKRNVQFEKAQTTKNQTSNSNAYKPRKRKVRSASFRMEYGKAQRQNDYGINGISSKRTRPKKYIYNPRQPGIPFGSTPRACNTPIRKDTPAVGLYDPYSPRVISATKQRMTINGKIGKAKRFKQEKPRAAPTGLYDSRWKYLKKKNPGCSFGSGNRFNKYNRKRNRNYKQEQRAILAEHYLTHNSKSSMKKKGGCMSKSKRFKQSKENIPGPGQYGLVHENNHERLPYSLFSKKK